MPELSVIVPALNEGERITACLDAVDDLRKAGAEIIVSDGGSSDDTVAKSRAAGAAVVCGARGRAAQMNRGAAGASGRLLAFLHADTIAGPAACARLLAWSAVDEELWGRFDVRLSGPGLAFRVIERMMNLRSRLSGIATGDQLMFVSSTLFHRVGGYPEVALMEDIRMSSTLKAVRPPRCASERVQTSSRKWRRDGVLHTVLLMWRLRLAHAMGADPATLARRYYGAG